MRQYYDTLGLQENASQEEIQAAYERLSKELNPSNNDNQELFKEEYEKVIKAYNTLNNSSILATEKGAKVISTKNKYNHKSSKDSLKKKKERNIFTYFLKRKRNILTFVVSVFILKLVLHFFLFPETEKAVNYDKRIYKNSFTLDYYTYENGSLIKNTSDYSLYSRLKPYHLYEGKDFFTKMGEGYILEPGVCNACVGKVFYYPKEIYIQSFKVHLQNIFSNKPYIFLISIGILLLLIILFNDKIEAR